MANEQSTHLSFDAYLEGVLGAWLGKFIGGTVGARFEGHKTLGSEKTETLWPDTIIPNDDLDIQVVWLEMLEERGPWFSQQDLVELWQDRCAYNFSEYGYFLHNVERGIDPPLSGRFNNTFFCESMGCPIRAEIWGCAAPGNPELAAGFARMDGELDHIGESIYAEQFWAAAMAVALSSRSLEHALAAGRAALPSESILHRVMDEVAEAFADGEDWRKIWRFLVRMYGHRDCSKGVINFSFTYLSLIACQGDFKRALTLAINCGWDVDCTAATAGALLGAIQGGSNLPKDWCEQLGKKLNCGLDVRHKDVLISDFALDTCKLGIEMAWARNKAVEITGVPDDIAKEVTARQAGRKPSPSIAMEVEYEQEPILHVAQEARVSLILRNTGNDIARGHLQLEPVNGLSISPESAQVSVRPNSSQRLTFSVCRSENSPTMWDRNLVSASWRVDGAPALEHVFGLAGARQWLVYGPYWDIYDTKKDEYCLFRHDGFACHPGQTEGGFYSCFHNHVRLDRPYLDEERLLVEDLPDECPMLLELGESIVDAQHVGSFTGEAVYYFVREVAASEPLKAQLVMGVTVPMAVWINGVECIRSESTGSWFPMDHSCIVEWQDAPKRIVIKLACPVDQWRFSMTFLRQGYKSQEKRVASYIEDRLGDRALSAAALKGTRWVKTFSGNCQ